MRNFTQFKRDEEKACLDIHCFNLEKREGGLRRGCKI